MSFGKEAMRIRLGVKTTKNLEFPENSDRLLIGVDPSMNDWLFTPDPFITGEFGTVLLLADGTSDHRYGAKAAHIVAYTIRQLFDELIELPPDDEGILRLLDRFFTKANQQVLLKVREVPEWFGYACATGLCLLHDYKAYVVWAGNVKVYKYSKFGVQGSFPQRLENLEQVNADHDVTLLNQLGIDISEIPYLTQSNLYTYHGQTHESFTPGKVVVPLEEDSILLMCSESITRHLGEKLLQDILDNYDEIDTVTEEIFGHFQEQFTQTNDVSALGVQILNGPSPVNPIRLNLEETKQRTAQLLNKTLPTIPFENNDGKTVDTTNKKPLEPLDIVPMRVRTVLPNEDGLSELKFVPQSPPKNKTPESLDIPSKNSEKDDLKIKQDQQSRKDQFLQKISPIIKKETPKEKIEIDSTLKGKPRIMATAYPDPEWRKTNEAAPIKNNPEEQEKPKINPENSSSGVPILEDNNCLSLEDNPITENEAEFHVADPIESESLQYFSLDDDDDEPLDYTIDTGEVDIENAFNSQPDEKESEDSTFQKNAEEERVEEEKTVFTQEIIVADALDSSEETLTEESIYQQVEEFDNPISTENCDIEKNRDEEQEDNVANTQGNEDETLTISDSILSDEKQMPANPSDAQSGLPFDNQTQKPSTSAKNIHLEDKGTIQKNVLSTAYDNPQPSPKTKSTFKVGTSILPGLKALNIRLIVIGLAGLVLVIWGLSTYFGDGDYEQLELDKPKVDAPKPERPTEKQASTTPPPVEPQKPVEQEKKEERMVTPDVKQEKKSEAAPITQKNEKEEKIDKKETIKTAPPVEPEYDDKIKANKQQLQDQVSALLAEKGKLCKQIDTYARNAPSRKIEAIKSLQYDCDQMSKKFQSIYDSKTGFFNTVRYDLLNSTIQNIQHSINQTEKKFLDVRND